MALDIRLYLKDEIKGNKSSGFKLADVLCNMAQKHTETVMPGYTHLQRAQPVTLGHHLMAYAQMFLRDLGRIEDTLKKNE